MSARIKMPLPRVLVSKSLFDRLMDYSCSTPSGTTIGKFWKCRVDYHDASKGWLLCCYGPHEDPNKVMIHYRRMECYPWIEGDTMEGGSDLPPLNKKASFR